MQHCSTHRMNLDYAKSPPPVVFCSVWHISHYKDVCRLPSTHFWSYAGLILLDCLLALEVMFLISITIQYID